MHVMGVSHGVMCTHTSMMHTQTYDMHIYLAECIGEGDGAGGSDSLSKLDPTCRDSAYMYL